MKICIEHGRNQIFYMSWVDIQIRLNEPPDLSSMRFVII
jgi:hypothetical protein